MRPFIFAILGIGLFACTPQTPQQSAKAHLPSHSYTYATIDSSTFKYHETDYVPVYSDIYHRDGTKRFQLAATISVRNTSLSDTAYIISADYQDSYGKLLKNYINKILQLAPLESIEFVVEEGENEGGAGAHFIVQWGAMKNSDQLLIQSIMIGTYGQQGISFLTNAKPIHKISKD